MFLEDVQNEHGYTAGCGVKWENGLLRPFIDDDGKKKVTIDNANVPVQELQQQGISLPIYNATTTLRKDQWKAMDEVVLTESRKRLKAWNDLVASARPLTFDAMGTPMLEHETMSDPKFAQVTMDGIADISTQNSPLFQAEGLPLPITSSGFSLSARKLAISRNSNVPLDVTQLEIATRAVSETVELSVCGQGTAFAYQTAAGQGYSNEPKTWGYADHPDINTKSDMTTPTGANPSATVDDILTMKTTLMNDQFYGPYRVYYSQAWAQYMDADYALTDGTNYGVAADQTLKQRIEKISGITSVEQLDFLTAGTLTILIVQNSSDVARAIQGMPMTVVQWSAHGGMNLNFQVMCIKVPQIRSTISGKSGIIMGTTS